MIPTEIALIVTNIVTFVFGADVAEVRIKVKLSSYTPWRPLSL
jgi:hypothetical protein